VKTILPNFYPFRRKNPTLQPQTHLLLSTTSKVKKITDHSKIVFAFVFVLIIIASTVLVFRSLPKSEIYPKATVELPKNSFRVNESPTFKLKLNETQIISSNKNVKAQILKPDGNIAENISTTIKQNSNEFNIQTNPIIAGSFSPGKYTLDVEIEKNGQIKNIQQDFTWGVLAINFNQTIYSPNDLAKLSFGTVDDLGHTICDASLTVEITTPNKNITTLSSKDGQIKPSGECGLDNITDVADYLSEYQIGNETGAYTIKYSAETKNGTRTITDYFEVRENIPFIVERTGPSRIYPPANYKVTLKITANQNYSGPIIETVPENFIVTKSQGVFAESIEGHNKNLTWQASLVAGQILNLSYIFDAPDISPEFFLLGPLSIGGGGEIRAWQIASDAVTANGNLFYGDTSATNGVLRGKTFTTTSTFGTEFNGAANSTSFILWTVAETAPTREEEIIGTLKVNGDLYVETCTTGCDANGDFTAQWNNPGTTPTQDCDTAQTTSTCERAFDIAYESLSGRAMVVYADNVADKFYYALWDGSAWSPDSSPGSPSATNEVDFHTGGTGGTPEWIRVISDGAKLGDKRSNRIMVLIADTNADLFACYWDGSSFSCLSAALDADLANCTVAQCFDGAWQGSGSSNKFIVNYLHTANSNVNYQVYTVGSGWGGENNAFTDAAAGFWIESNGDPTSSRIMVSTGTSGDDYSHVVWRADNSSDGWTECSGGVNTTNCPDTGTEGVGGKQSSAVFQRQQAGGTSGLGLVVYNDAGTTTDGNFMTYTPTSSYGTKTRTGITTSDDSLSIKLYPNENTDDVMMLTADVDCDLYGQLWTGSSFGGTAVVDIEANNSMYGVACPGATGPDATTGGEGSAFSYEFTWKIYTPWSRNWRFYNDETNNTPSSGVAAENTTGSVAKEEFIRLRMQFYERGAVAQTDARKKLQYTSGCTPSTVPDPCTWSDVGDTGETSAVWRYATSGDTCGSCSDNTAVGSSALTGTTQNGTYTSDKNDAAGANMDHTASAILEVDYPLKAEDVTAATTYYFRAYDNDQLTPVFTYNPSGVTDCLSSACTYPSVSIPADPITVSGNVYTAGTASAPALCDHTTPAYNVAIRSNGVTTTTFCNDSTGAFSDATVMPPAAGEGIIVWIDGDATDGSTSIRYDGSGNSTGHIVYTNTATVTSDDSTAIDNTDMDTYDSGNDGDIPYTVSSNNLSVTTGIELLVFTGKTYTPNGTVTTNGTADFHIDDSATATLGSATNAMARDILVDAGATLNINADTTIAGGDIVTASTGAVANTAGTPTVTMNGTGNIGGGSGAITIYNLTISNTFTTTITSSTTISNSLTVTGSIGSSTSVTTTVNGSISGGGTINYTGTSTFKQRVAVNQNFGATSGATAWNFVNLTFSNSSGSSRTITTQTGGTGAINVSGDLTLGEGGDGAATVLDAGNRTWTLSGTDGTPTAVNASSTLTGNTSTFAFTGNNGSGDTTISALTFTNLTLNASETFNAGGTITANGDLTVTTGTFALGTNNITVGSTTAGSGDVSISGSITQSASGTFSAKTAAAATPTFGGSGTISLYNLSFEPGAAGASYTLGSGASQTITVANNLTIGDDTNSVTVNADTNDPTIDVNGNFLINTSATYQNSATVAMTVAKNFTQDGTYTHNGGTISLDGSTTSDDSTVTCSGTIGGSIGFSKTGDGDITIGSGCTVASPGSGISMTGNIINNGTINNGGTTFNLDNLTGGEGDLINNGGATITYSGTAMTIEGDFTQSSTFNLTGITVTLDGSSSSDNSTVICGTLGGTLAFNKTGGATVTINTSCTVAVTTISMTGNYINNGTTNISGSTFNLDSTSGNGGSLTNGASATMTYSGTIITLEKDYTHTAGTTFNLSGKTLTFDGSDTTDDSTLTCSTTLAGTHDIAKTIQGADFTLSASCVITMVASVTTYGSITVNGSMTGTTITTRGSVLKDSGGTLVVAGNTLVFEDGGVDTDSTLDCEGGTITGAVEQNMTHAGSTLTMVSSCTITDDFIRTDGAFSNPGSAYTLTLQEDFSMSTTDTFGGANLTLTLNGTVNPQTITQNAGTMSGIFTVNKSAGVAQMNTDFTTGSTCTVTDGTFFLNSFDFNCGSTFTVTDTLQMEGNELPTTPTLSVGSYVIFVGDNDTVADVYNIPNYTWRNLTIDSDDGNTDTFTQQVNTTVNENFCIITGTYDLDSLSLDVVGTVCNNGGIMTNAGDFNYDSNTILLTDSGYSEDNNFTQGDTIYMTVTDASVNLNGGSAETLSVSITTTTGDSETKTLTETGSSTAIFRGSITSAWGTYTTSNNNIEMVLDDVITLSYTDANDGTDTGSDTANTTADAPPAGSGKLVSTNFEMDGAFGSFGDRKSSTNYTLTDTGGVLAAGPGESTNYDLGSGFQYWNIGSNRLELTISSTTIAFGTLTPGTPATNNHNLQVVSDAPGGYQVTAQEVTRLANINYAGFYIPDVLGDASNITHTSAGAWSSGTTYGFGYTLANVTGTDAAFTSNYRHFADLAFAESPVAVMSNVGTTNDSEITVTYKVNVSAAQEAGNYETKVTYILTGTY